MNKTLINNTSQHEPHIADTGEDQSENKRTFTHLLIGPPRDIRDPNVFHHLSLIAFLA